MTDEMETQMKILALAKCLRGFGIIELKQILSITSKSFWKKDEDAFLEGDTGRDMFIICAGKISIWRENAGHRLELATLSAGESFGEMGLVDVGKRSAGAHAMENTLALRIRYDRLHEVPSAAAILYKNIAKELAGRLTNANDIIVFQAKLCASSVPLTDSVPLAD